MSQPPLPRKALLLLDLQSGISGDMFVAAAAALAGCEAEVAGLPARLGLDGVSCVFKTVIRGGLQCRKFDVLEEAHSQEHTHTHDGVTHTHSHPHAHGKPHTHSHAHVHAEDAAQHGHHHDHRGLSDIKALINAADLDTGVKARALRMFDALGAVEAEAHGVPLESVHFHEVGAIDSIIDIVAAALCIERLAPAKVRASSVCVGKGAVRTSHGLLPVPAPATEKLLHGITTHTGELSGEWTTPTGALIVRELAPEISDAPCSVVSSACGAGNKDTATRPNMVRLRLATEAASGVTAKVAPDAFGTETSATLAKASAPTGLLEDEVVVLQTNIDNTTGELLSADFLDLLLRAGARDALLHPVLMKKGRPAQQLEVLAAPADAQRLAALILTHTSTIGVRMTTAQRLMLPREAVQLETPFGPVAAKRVTLPSGETRTQPEYEACRALAEKSGVPVQTVYRSAGDTSRH